MSREIPVPAQVTASGIRLRSNWRPRDADLIVDLHRRGLGLGKALFDAAMAYAGAQGWPEVYLETTDGLPASMQLYLAAGFMIVRDEETELWDGPGRMIVMTKHLATPPE